MEVGHRCAERLKRSQRKPQWRPQRKRKKKTKRETARNLIALNQMSVETIAKCVDLPVEEVRALAERKPA